MHTTAATVMPHSRFNTLQNTENTDKLFLCFNMQFYSRHAIQVWLNKERIKAEQ